jgi:hypothetical protein
MKLDFEDLGLVRYMLWLDDLSIGRHFTKSLLNPIGIGDDQVAKHYTLWF